MNPNEGTAPPGWERSVEQMQQHPAIDNPCALAWWMQNEGYTAAMAEDPECFLDGWERFQQARLRGTLLGEVELAASGVGWAQAVLLGVRLRQGLRLYREQT